MPRPPGRAGAVERIPASVYWSKLPDGEVPPARVVPLNVGDTWLPPVPGARMEDLAEAAYPDLHRYAHPRGVPELVEALAAKLRARNALACGPESVLVTAGATGALACAVGAIGGPLAYWGAARGWQAVQFEPPAWRATAALAAGWALALPALTAGARRWTRKAS